VIDSAPKQSQLSTMSASASSKKDSKKVSNPIASLLEATVWAESAAEAQGKKHNLTDRDLRRASISVKKTRAVGGSTSFKALTEEINLTKEGADRVGVTTLWNNTTEANIACGAQNGNWPRYIGIESFPRWPRNRRGFCKIWKCNHKATKIMCDECFFGLERRCSLFKPEIHPEGSLQERKHNPQGKSSRVTVWGGMGPDLVVPLVIDENG
jgi:hypothetical protein